LLIVAAGDAAVTPSTRRGSFLRGVRVLELDEGIAASVAGMLLADQGADVIRVERGGSTVERLPAHAVWNRGKRTLRRDLASPAASAALRELADGADVAIWGDSCEALQRAGLGPQALLDSPQGRGPVVCRVGGLPLGWGAGTAASDAEVAALSGLFRDGRHEGDVEHSRPGYYPLALPSVFAGLLLAGTAVASLYARGLDRHARGCVVSLLSAMLVPAGLGAIRLNGGRLGNRAAGRNAGDDSFQCADGRWITVYQGKRHLMQGYLRVLGLADEFTGVSLNVPELPRDPRAEELYERVAAAFRTRPAAEWERLLSEAGTTGTICRTPLEWLATEHARRAGLSVEVGERDQAHVQPGPLLREAGRTRRPRPARVVSRARWRARAVREPPLQTPRLDLQHAPPRQATLHRDGEECLPRRGGVRSRGEAPGPLAGVRVLDFTVILAGPTAGRLLAEWGAEVIKIDAPAEAPRPYIWLETGRGKRSLLLDLKSAQGREVVWKLLATADVVLENFRDGVMTRLGFGYEQVRRRFPGIVYASSNTFGYGGDFSGRPGYEPIAESATGMQLRYGGPGRPPRHAPSYAVVDYATGVAGAFGVACALLRRQRTGRGVHVETSLCAGAELLQSIYAGAVDGAEREIEGPDVLGVSALRRLYACADDWLYLHCDEEQAPALFKAIGDPTLEKRAGAASVGGPLAEAIGARLAERTLDEWLARLSTAGVAAAPVYSPERLLADERMRRLGLLRETDVPGLGRVSHAAPPVTLSPSPAASPAITPIGAHTEPLLAELGYTSDQIAALLKGGVVAAQSW
jgi:crotonobetainyl-CoA:carnitine CoA-transferase CaiB-like acyl-CoA transferase